MVELRWVESVVKINEKFELIEKNLQYRLKSTEHEEWKEWTDWIDVPTVKEET